jgi:hypothetical protein
MDIEQICENITNKIIEFNITDMKPFRVSHEASYPTWVTVIKPIDIGEVIEVVLGHEYIQNPERFTMDETLDKIQQQLQYR